MSAVRRAARHPMLGAFSAAILTYLVLGDWTGLVLSAVVAVGVYRWLARAGATRRRPRALAHAAANLPFTADLLGEALRSGAPVDRAVAVVGEAVGGPLGERLVRVSRALALGAPPTEAWSHLDDIAGAERVTSAAVRSANSGAALAATFHRVAEELRGAHAVAAEAAAHRLSTLIVLPLGLCFLPAFLLTGVVPVVLATLAQVLR
ncbi:MAG TPA: type II secretion system F family protein [Micromonosporaceae bacterium]